MDSIATDGCIAICNSPVREARMRTGRRVEKDNPEIAAKARSLVKTALSAVPAGARWLLVDYELEKCRVCQGRDEWREREPCDVCDGSGYLESDLLDQEWECPACFEYGKNDGTIEVHHKGIDCGRCYHGWEGPEMIDLLGMKCRLEYLSMVSPCEITLTPGYPGRYVWKSSDGGYGIIMPLLR